MNSRITKVLTISCITLFLTCIIGCGDDDEQQPFIGTTGDVQFVLGVEATSGADVLLPVNNLMEGIISPLGSGFEQPAWMSYINAGNTLITSGYATDNTLTGYRLVNGTLTNIGSLITELQTYNYVDVDDNTLLAVGVTRAGFEERIIYTIDKNDMSIRSRARTRIDERKEDGLVAWPTDLIVKGNKLFMSYYLLGAGEDDGVPAFATPNSNEARIAIYSYPELEFEKIITDNRTSDIGNYLSFTSLQEDEMGDIYSFSTSSLASGFTPTPTNPSGFLRIKNGATDFDDSYFFNFETASGGYKVNNAVYAGNGKAVVRMVKDDSGLWATYDPDAENPICSIAIADLYNQTVTKVTEVPLHGGEWGMAHLIHDGKVYINVSDVNGAFIYEVDPGTASAKKGAQLEGNWTKGILALKK
ncbi:DUF4374 domain-containing protein [Fulvivirga sp. M361]|uniref:DUF4374 domain-containing protein n=1 Tax=Fulvivirga sp. M361 TaxID=2594266 RepID=UPI00117B6E53|nr:DUF4374 domain-containing protein [Fulvivirga sp. M361]TRX60731.1 DUF4374 domain-containing protein [Fulvivirga sp. M361]